MPARTNEILTEVLSMPPEERAELVDSILASLEPCDPRILELWASEAEDRVAAFERNEIEAARIELREAIAYYSEQLNGLGFRFSDEVKKAIKRLFNIPKHGHDSPEPLDTVKSKDFLTA
jgi:hypothetical protein